MYAYIDPSKVTCCLLILDTVSGITDTISGVIDTVSSVTDTISRVVALPYNSCIIIEIRMTSSVGRERHWADVNLYLKRVMRTDKLTAKEM